MSRFSRQLDLVPPEKLAQERILLVGAGAVGRNLGHTLAALGAKSIRVVDFDSVEDVNIATQGYSKNDLGKKKSEVLSEFMKGLDYEGDADFQFDVEMWSPKKYREYQPTTVFSCVDSMQARRSIYEFCKKVSSVQLFVDTRMLGNNIRLLTYTRANLPDYENSLFNDDEAEPGRCTRRSTMYAASILANHAAAQLAFHLKGFKTKTNFQKDLLDELLA